MTTADEIAHDIRHQLAAGDTVTAIRMLMDGVNRLPSVAEQGDLQDLLGEPSSTGDRRWDTLLAAAIRYRLHTLGRHAPEWTWKQPLDAFWWPIRTNASKEYNDMAHTPAELLRVNIFMDERGFATA